MSRRYPVFVFVLCLNVEVSMNLLCFIVSVFPICSYALKFSTTVLSGGRLLSDGPTLGHWRLLCVRRDVEFTSGGNVKEMLQIKLEAPRLGIQDGEADGNHFF